MNWDESRGCSHVDAEEGAPVSVKLNNELYSFCDVECLSRWAVDTCALYEVEQLDQNL